MRNSLLIDFSKTKEKKEKKKIKIGIEIGIEIASFNFKQFQKE